MLSYSILKTIHIAGVFLFLTAISVLLFSEKKHFGFKITANVSLLLILIAGLGLIFQPHIVGMPIWVLVKFGIWVLIGGLGTVIASRFPRYRAHAYIGLIVLASLAAFLAIHKP